MKARFSTIMDILRELRVDEKNTIQGVCRAIGRNFSSISKTLTKLENSGIIRRVKRKEYFRNIPKRQRKNNSCYYGTNGCFVFLTEKGGELYQVMNEVLEIYGDGLL